MLHSKDFVSKCLSSACSPHFTINGVNITLDFCFITAILGFYHVYIPTISYFSEICDQLPDDTQAFRDYFK